MGRSKSPGPRRRAAAQPPPSTAAAAATLKPQPRKPKPTQPTQQEQKPQPQPQPRWSAGGCCKLLTTAVALALGAAALALRFHRAAHPFCDGADVLRRFSGGGGVFSSSSAAAAAAVPATAAAVSSPSAPPRVVVTGANSGVGFETARLLALGGARVTLGCRDEGRCQAAADAIDSAVAEACGDWREQAGFGGGGGAGDVTGGAVTGPHGECRGGAFVVDAPLQLGSLASVERFARAVLHPRGGAAAGVAPLRALVLNAGVFPTARGPATATPSAAGGAALESSFAVNHLGHFHLANLLLPALEAAADGGGEGGRIAIVSSEEGHRIFSQLGEPAELPLPLSGGGWWWGGFKAYGLSKLANVLHAQELGRRLSARRSAVTASALHPGFVATRIGRPTRTAHHGASSSSGGGGGGGGGGWSLSDALADAFWLLAAPLTKTPAEGAATSLFAVLAPAALAAPHAGAYLDDCAVRAPAARTLGGAGAAAGARLWALSERLVAEDRAARRQKTAAAPPPASSSSSSSASSPAP